MNNRPDMKKLKLILVLVLSVSFTSRAADLILGGETVATNIGQYTLTQTSNVCACCDPFPRIATNSFNRSWTIYSYLSGCGSCLSNMTASTTTPDTMPDPYHDLTPTCPSLPGIPATTHSIVSAACTLRPVQMSNSTALWKFTEYPFPTSPKTPAQLHDWFATNWYVFAGNTSVSVSESVGDSGCDGNITLSIEVSYSISGSNICNWGLWDSQETFKISSQYSYVPDDDAPALNTSPPATVTTSAPLNPGALVSPQSTLPGWASQTWCASTLFCSVDGMRFVPADQLTNIIIHADEEDREFVQGACAMTVGFLAGGVTSWACGAAFASDIVPVVRVLQAGRQYRTLSGGIAAGRSVTQTAGLPCSVFETVPYATTQAPGFGILIPAVPIGIMTWKFFDGVFSCP